MSTVKDKLKEMQQLGIIEAVNEPSEWCAPLVTVAKPNGDIRLCVDLTKLNASVEREYHPMPVIEHTLGQLGGAKVFSKLDANSGFYQIPLSPECQHLTTFITPFGRYRFLRIPFGITSAPEHFQRRMSEILKDLPGVVIHIDDVLITGKSPEEHDKRLRDVLHRLRVAGVALNKEKCIIGVSSIKFLGHAIDEKGITVDADKVTAIKDMVAPSSATEVKRFLGMANFLGRFIPHLSQTSKPLNDLTRANHDFVWGPDQEKAFNSIKSSLIEAAVLALFDVRKETMITSDASSFGLGTALLQKQEDGHWRPIAFASRTMTASEQRYAQIKKDALGITSACERFRDFVTGLHFTIETDHKPLLPIFTSKNVDDLSPRLQRFRIRMMRYSFEMKYTPGRNLILADTLSRSPLNSAESTELAEEVAYAYVSHMVAALPASDEKLSHIWTAQVNDPDIKQVMKLCMSQWPSRIQDVAAQLRKYWTEKDFTVQNGLLLKENRLVISRCLQEEMLGKIHDGHLGITKCRARAREAVWWPGISEDIAEMIRRCPVCVQQRKERKEPLMPSSFPSRPWQRIAMDLFHFGGRWYLLVLDYYSRFPEVVQLGSLTTSSIITHLKDIFSRHGVPEEVMTDNGPQFYPLSTSPFRQFSRDYGFVHNTSSPRFPQSNGFEENGVEIVKNLLKKNQDWRKAIMEYRASPLTSNGLSPAELLMGRRIRSTLSMDPTRLIPNPVDADVVAEKESKRIASQAKNFNKRHGVIQKSDFELG